MHYADRLTSIIKSRGNALCVGLDPRWEQLPLALRQKYGTQSLESIAAAYEEFCLRILDLVSEKVPIIKPQSAFFEACGPAGMSALRAILQYAHKKGLFTILDSKRNDIASTALAYADAAFAGVRFENSLHPIWDADALTINPYLGRDAVEPFLSSARQGERGVFVLVRTSNKGAGQFQDMLVEGEPLYQKVGKAVAEWNRENLGECGLGDVGAVVGATHPQELKNLRQLLPEVWFLIPGFGAQGGTAQDVAAGFRPDGLGAIVNSSRGITACFPPEEPNWEKAVVQAVENTIAALEHDTPMGNL